MGFSDYRTALVTGASSGIGAETVRRLREAGDLQWPQGVSEAAEIDALMTPILAAERELERELSGVGLARS